jgi:eukaryotic-like serine/threonine-protein kinase
VTTCPVMLGGRYRLDERIGAGGMGEVWRATDTTLRRRVAVKLLPPEVARDAERLAKFRIEAQSAAAVQHPGIAQVYDYCDDADGGLPYLVMELVDGTSLDRLLEDGPLGAAFTMSIVAQVAEGLAAAHAAGVVHRDIKPQNLLATREGQIKITDFGIARMMRSAVATSTGELVCTPAYLAPERGLGAAATPAADLYALGIVAYQCLAGRLPFTGEPLAVVLAHQNQPLPPLPRQVPAKAAALVAALTAKSPEARPASAAEVAAWAAQLQGTLTHRQARPVPPAAFPAAEPGTPSPAAMPLAMPAAGPGGRRRRPGRLGGRAGLALASVGVVGLAGWMLTHMPGSPSADLQIPPPPAATGSPHPHRAAGAAIPHDSPTARHEHGQTLRVPGHRAHRHHHPHPVSTPKPKGSPTPSASPGKPSPSPTPSATSPAPSPSPTPSTPSPTPSATSTVAS